MKAWTSRELNRIPRSPFVIAAEDDAIREKNAAMKTALASAKPYQTHTETIPHSDTGWNETLNEYEAREADEFWGAAEMSCATCGID